MKRLFIFILLILFLVSCEADNEIKVYETEEEIQVNTSPNLKLESKPIGYYLEQKKILKFGKIPSSSTRQIITSHTPLMNYLKKELNLKDVKLVLAPTYEKLTEFILTGKVDVAWHASLLYPQDRDKGLKCIIQPIRDNVDYYEGMIVTRYDSGLYYLSDLKNKKFAFSEKASASGYFYPYILFLEHGIIPEQYFKQIQYISGHDKILYNILYKKVDAGAVYYDARELLNKNKREKFYIIAKTKRIPNEPIVVHKDLPLKWVNRIKHSFFKLKKEDKELKPLNIDYFHEVYDSEYDGIIKDIQKYKSIKK